MGDFQYCKKIRHRPFSNDNQRATRWREIIVVAYPRAWTRRECDRRERPGLREARTMNEDDPQRTIDQLALNQRWLIERIDEIHAVLCPGQRGT